MRSVHILLCGASGIPGRNILNSLKRLQSDGNQQLTLTVAKRQDSNSTTSEHSVAVTNVSSYADTPDLARLLREIRPDVIVSALKAEPAPELDNFVIDAIELYLEQSEQKIYFINGFTLDLLDPSISKIATEEILKPIQAKINFAHRLASLSSEQPRFTYTTIVNASFLDYTLVKGYNGIDAENSKATLFDGGKKILTGCSLDFVGDAVAAVVSLYTSESGEVLNQRLRIAETTYSGEELLQNAEEITGRKFEVNNVNVEKRFEDGAMNIISYLNWSMNSSASSFLEDGLLFAQNTYLRGKRRTLQAICEKAINNDFEQLKSFGR